MPNYSWRRKQKDGLQDTHQDLFIFLILGSTFEGPWQTSAEFMNKQIKEVLPCRCYKSQEIFVLTDSPYYEIFRREKDIWEEKVKQLI